MTNEFENNVEEDFPEPTSTVSTTINTQEDLISSGPAGTVYDWSKAPEGVKAPPRIDLDGKTVTIKKAEIILPAENLPWLLTLDKKKEFKYCKFTLYFDYQGQQESYAGVRVFLRDENGVKKYSHPTITRDRHNQASRLLGAMADYKGLDINEISLKTLLGFLNGLPKAVIKKETVKNPETGQTIEKNIIEKFVD
jgi:hypothetical protein